MSGWHIHFDPKPIPDRSHDWSFYHDDHDGENGLCGTAKSPEDAREQIAEIEHIYTGCHSRADSPFK